MRKSWRFSTPAANPAARSFSRAGSLGVLSTHGRHSRLTIAVGAARKSAAMTLSTGLGVARFSLEILSARRAAKSRAPTLTTSSHSGRAGQRPTSPTARACARAAIKPSVVARGTSRWSRIVVHRGELVEIQSVGRKTRQSKKRVGIVQDRSRGRSGDMVGGALTIRRIVRGGYAKFAADWLDFCVYGLGLFFLK